MKLNRLAQRYITDSLIHFKRNHGPIPTICDKSYRLVIGFDENKEDKREFDLDAIKSFPKAEVVAVLQCAGNRRDGQAKVKPVNGVIWGPGTISNACWGGARLRDILIASGLPKDTCDEFYAIPRHVAFEGYGVAADDTFYGGSIPLDWAMDPRNDVLIAYQMNGEVIPRDHGFPCRLVVPGVIGARWVKWICRITIQLTESNNYYQQRDYKILPPNANKSNHNEFWARFPALHEFNVQSVICSPNDGDIAVQSRPLQVKGYAVAGGGRAIDRVEVSIDGGKSWKLAQLFGVPGNSKQVKISRNQKSSVVDDKLPEPSPPVESGQKHWAWTLWSFTIDNVPTSATSKIKIMCRGWDTCGNTQPSTVTWNYRGVMNNGYFSVCIQVVPPSSL